VSGFPSAHLRALIAISSVGIQQSSNASSIVRVSGHGVTHQGAAATGGSRPAGIALFGDVLQPHQF